MARTGRDESAPLDDGRGDDPRALVDMSRSWRPVLLIALVTFVAFVIPLLVLPGTSERRAEARATELDAALTSLRADLGPTQQVLKVLTEPTASPDDYVVLLPVIADLRTHAAAAAAVAEKGVPFAWPLASSAPFEELKPTVQAARSYAATASALVDDLVTVLNYRGAYVGVMDVGDLPPTAPQRFDRFISELGDLSDQQQALLEDLPRYAPFADHRSTVGDSVRRFESWVEDYINALFIGDTSTVAELFLELEVMQRTIDIAMVSALDAVRNELDTTILQLEDDLDGVVSDLG